MTFKRYDPAPFGKAIKLDNGFLKAPARLTRTGVFEYRQNDGSVVRELRLPEEVFHPDSIASFELLPLTDEHPEQPLTADNAKALSVGSIGEPKQDGEFLSAQLLVTSDSMVKKVLAGKQEISCGYFCTREPAAPGATYNGKPYDFIQRNIRGNHVAIVSHNRAGPEARIRLDSQTAVLVTDTEQKEPLKMAKLTIDGADFEVPEEVQKAVDASIAKVTAERDAAKATCDSLISEKAELQTKLEKATSTETIQAAVATRVALEKSASVVLSDVKFDGLSDSEIKAKAASKAFPQLNLDGKSADYVNALFEAAVQLRPTANTVTEKAEELLKTAPRQDSIPSHNTYEEALAKAREEFFKR